MVERFILRQHRDKRDPPELRLVEDLHPGAGRKPVREQRGRIGASGRDRWNARQGCQVRSIQQGWRRDADESIGAGRDRDPGTCGSWLLRA